MLGAVRFGDSDHADSGSGRGVRICGLERGALRRVNPILLGAIADLLPFPPEVLEARIVERFRARKPHLVEANKRAFAAGRAHGGD